MRWHAGGALPGKVGRLPLAKEARTIDEVACESYGGGETPAGPIVVEAWGASPHCCSRLASLAECNGLLLTIPRANRVGCLLDRARRRIHIPLPIHLIEAWLLTLFKAWMGRAGT